MTRPSQRPMLRLCPSSQLPGYTLGIDGVHVRTGIAVDELLTEYLRTGTPAGPERLQAVVDRHAVDHAEVAERLARGYHVLEQLDDVIRGDCVVQEALDGPMGPGTPDAYSPVSMFVLDWKSREPDHDIRDQVMHYAHNLRHEVGGDLGGDQITCVLAYLATGHYEVWRVGDRELDEWEAEQRRLQAQVGTVYNPGDHCARCHRQLECQARRDWAGGGLYALQLLNDGHSVPAESAVTVYPQVVALEKMLKDYRAAIKEAVLAAGSTPVDDEHELAVIDVERKRLDPQKGVDVLLRLGWTDDQIDAASELQIGKVEAIAKADAPRGQKKQAVIDINEALAEGGAITTTTSKTLKMRKARRDD